MALRRSRSGWTRETPARRRKPAELAALAGLIAAASAACAARHLPPANPALGASTAARYRATWQAGPRSGSFRIQAYAAAGGRLRLDLLPPVGGVRLSLVCDAGRGLALVPPERAYWEGPCDAGPSGEAGMGLPRGGTFWARVLLGEIREAGSAAGEDDLRIEPGGEGEPPLRVEASLSRGGRRASIALVRQSLLPAAGEEAFARSIPEGFAERSSVDLFDFLVPEEEGDGGDAGTRTRGEREGPG